MPRGGLREGAGRPTKTDAPAMPLEACRAPHAGLETEDAGQPKVEVVEATLQTATLLEVAIGQSSVKLELDSKGQVKPTVHVYHRSPKKAAATAEAEMDRLLLKYAALAAVPQVAA